jgi:hypothetical protein
MVTEVSQNIGLGSGSICRVTEEENLPGYSGLALGMKGNSWDDNAKEKILANLRVLARTNLVLKGRAERSHSAVLT